jgi:F-type H+-transporting ATPase subunit delta
MSENVIVKRYVKALYQVFDSNVEQAKTTMPYLQAVAELFKIKEARDVLKSPVMPSDVKSDLVMHALNKAGAAPKALKDFFQNIIDSNRVMLAPSLAENFKEFLNEKEGIIGAQVISAVKLEDADLESVKSELSKRFSKKIDLEFIIDKTIIGGLLIKVGNSIIDLTLKTKLDNFAKEALKS